MTASGSRWIRFRNSISSTEFGTQARPPGKNGEPMLKTDTHYTRDADEVIRRLGDLNATFAGREILLTGAAGFLGVQFVHYFLRLNESGRLAAPCRLTA